MEQYTIQDVAKLTGISIRSLRNYLRQYEEQFDPERGACNALIFGDADLEVFIRIRTFLRQGKSRDEILKILAGDTAEGEVVVRRADVAAGGGEVSAQMTEVVRHLEAQTAILETLAQENLRLRRRMEVLEVRLRLRDDENVESALLLPASTARRVRVRPGALRIPLPYFLLRVKDGAQAAVRAVTATLRRERR